MLFSEFVGEESLQFNSARHVEEFMKDESQVFAMFTSLHIEGKMILEDFPIVYELPDVFPDDITELPPERERERES